MMNPMARPRSMSLAGWLLSLLSWMRMVVVADLVMVFGLDERKIPLL